MDQLQRARLERLRAQIAFARTGSADIPGLTIGPEAPALLLDAARRLETLDVELARETYLEAVTAAMWIGSESRGCGIRAVAEAARQAPPGPQPPRPVPSCFWTVWRRGSPNPTRRPCRGSGKRCTRWPGQRDAPMTARAGSGSPAPRARTSSAGLWDDQTWHYIATRAVRICRDTGALAVLPNALTYRACLHVLAGEFAAAMALTGEAYAIAEETGSAPLRYPSLLLVAWRGQETEALNVIDMCIKDAKARGLERPIRFAQCVTALLYNGLGRYDEALAAAQRARADSQPITSMTWVSSAGRSSSWSRPVSTPAILRSRRTLCGDSRNEPAPAAPTGRSVSERGHGPCSAKARPPSVSTRRPSSTCPAPAFG